MHRANTNIRQIAGVWYVQNECHTLKDETRQPAIALSHLPTLSSEENITDPSLSYIHEECCHLCSKITILSEY